MLQHSASRRPGQCVKGMWKYYANVLRVLHMEDLTSDSLVKFLKREKTLFIYSETLRVNGADANE